MKDKPIFFLDSGIGGLPYVESTRSRLPQETIYYLADRAHFPYGEKEPAHIIQILHDVVDKICRQFTPKMLVLACNTASVVALESLRQTFSLPIIGVVPAIKPAAEQSDKGRIGILATERTVKDPYTEGLVKRFASHCHVVSAAAGDIVSFVENHYQELTAEQGRQLIGHSVKVFQEADVDRLVLGCTHFLYIEEVLRDVLGETIELVDSRAGVSRQIERVLTEQHLIPGRGGADKFLLSGNRECVVHYGAVAKKYGFSTVEAYGV